MRLASAEGVRWSCAIIGSWAFGALSAGCFEKECGPNQKLKSGVCVCAEGTKADETNKCIALKDAGPDPDDAPSDADAAMEPAAPSSGCDMTTGLGCACKGDDDCASYKADYCILPDPADPEMKRACMLQGCDKPNQECPKGMHCCDFPFAPEKTVCLPEDFKCPF